MALPLRYSARNLIVRRASSLLTALGIAMTVAVFAGIFALREGFEQLYRPMGSQDRALYLRVGSTSEGESGLRRQTAEILMKERPEISRDASGRPLAAAEIFPGGLHEQARRWRYKCAAPGHPADVDRADER